MTHETKTFKAELKADGEGLKAGQFIAYVSMFDNVDLGGDRIVKGAFSRTLQEWQAKGDPLPIIWSHEWDNPNAHVGYADPKDIEETDQGLKIKATLDVDRPFAEQVSHLLKNRRITQFSFGYFAKDYEMVDDEVYGKVRELKDVDIFEAGPTLLGMNPATQLLEAASYRAQKDLDANGQTLTQHQTLEYQALESIVEEAGKFDQSELGHGAHYAPAEANPFKDAGLMCQNCVFYDGPQACEIVEGVIEPEAVCKFWIIPEALLGAPADTMPEGMSTEGEAKEVSTLEKDSEVEEPAKSAGEDETQSDTSDSGDIEGTIDIERYMALIVRTQNNEE